MGSRGNNGSCSALCWISVPSPTTHNQIWPFWFCFTVCRFVYILGPHESPQGTLLWGWEFLHCCLNPHRCFQSEVWGFISLVLKPWVARSGLLPSCSSWFICRQMRDHPLHQPWPLWVHQRWPCPESSPLECPSPLLLLVWMNVSSLSPWLSDFHTVRYSVSSGCFLFLNYCPSFGCVRRHSVSTYASILAGSQKDEF